jgi:hypothetical protein
MAGKKGVNEERENERERESEREKRARGYIILLYYETHQLRYGTVQ